MGQKPNIMSDIKRDGFLERFSSQIMTEPNTGCWIWVGTRNFYGYGNISFFKKNKRAHRVSYECYRGEIPDGLEPDHLCRVRCCVNPDHLELVTHAENVRRQHMAHRAPEYRSEAVCKNGHPWTAETLTRQPNGSRACLLCKRDYDREHKRKWRSLNRINGAA